MIDIMLMRMWLLIVLDWKFEDVHLINQWLDNGSRVADELSKASK